VCACVCVCVCCRVWLGRPIAVHELTRCRMGLTTDESLCVPFGCVVDNRAWIVWYMCVMCHVCVCMWVCVSVCACVAGSHHRARTAEMSLGAHR
jgi:hypothetical protein